MRFMVPVMMLLLAAAKPAVDPCPATSNAWIELSSIPDSLMVPPQFFFDQPTVPLEAIIVCEHGVFFNVHAPQDKTSKEYYVSFPFPTHEELKHYVPRDTLMSVKAAKDPDYIDRYVDRQVVASTARYNQLKTDLRRLLGKRYAEGTRIEMIGSPVEISLGFPLTLVWDKESLPFYTTPGIYWRKE